MMKSPGAFPSAKQSDENPAGIVPSQKRSIAEPSAQDLHAAYVYGKTPQRWPGWRFTDTGTELVSPSGQRFTPQRLEGIAWRLEAEARRDAARARRKASKPGLRGMVTVVRLNAADWHRERFGSIAG